MGTISRVGAATVPQPDRLKRGKTKTADSLTFETRRDDSINAITRHEYRRGGGHWCGADHLYLDEERDFSLSPQNCSPTSL